MTPVLSFVVFAKMYLAPFVYILMQPYVPGLPEGMTEPLFLPLAHHVPVWNEIPLVMYQRIRLIESALVILLAMWLFWRH